MVPPEVREQVVFLGAVYEERADVYATADLVVLPARSGSFSIIILEALAAGRPVVSTPFVKGWQNERHFRPVRVAPDFTPEAVADTVAEALAAASRFAHRRGPGHRRGVRLERRR